MRVNSPGSITQWIDQVRDGDSLAAQKIWEEYFHRLVGLARGKLKGMPRRVADEEDVVVDAFHSFCRAAEAGRFPALSDRRDLWHVLVMITARKAVNQIKHARRQKRGGGNVRGDSFFLDVMSNRDRAGIDSCVGDAPTPEFACQMVEEFEHLLGLLDDVTLQRIAIAKLEGFSSDEIAAQFNVRTRTIERKLRLIREIWHDEF